ncbi:hypothetical protein [Dechloromonas agitata]|uniref:hypothetical protein n=1 Tax=Dechloromonas agitata TaxID=73030 RepID=UPI0012FC6370|nr:hypothetical protein [Dechloromonas agitata]
MAEVLDIAGRGIACSAPRHRWLSVDALLPGMVLAKDVVGEGRGIATMRFAEGSTLTADTIRQIVTKSVECVAILDEHPPEADEYELLCLAHEARLREIFCCADNESPTGECQSLFEALVVAGPIL